MPDLREYGLAVERDVVPPQLTQLVRVAQRRRRRSLVAVTAVAALVLAASVLVGAGGLVGSQRVAPPAQHSTGQASALPPSQWTARDVVGHPDAAVLYTIDAADPRYRLRSVPASDHDGRVTVWHRCSVGASTVYPSDCAGEGVGALEVSGSRGAPLLMMAGGAFFEYSLEYVGDGRFFLAGTPFDGPDMLIGAGMTEPLPLTQSPDLAPMTPGTDHVLCSDLPPCVLDVAAGTVTAVDVPGLAGYDLALWADATEDGLWGMVSKNEGPPELVLLDRPGGTLRKMPSGDTSRMVLPLDTPPGVMAYFTTWDCCYPAWHNMPILGRLHVSTDQGRTWRVLQVPEGVEGSLDRERYVTHLPTLPDGWETWPEADR